MSNEDGSVWLSCNGEIYNYRSLREELQKLGHRFRSESDSEVIVHGYEEWGTGVLQRLNGMFAFGIWDQRSETLFLARDRFGIKPLYYYQSGDQFLFASEIKAFKTNPELGFSLNQASVSEYLNYRYVPSPNTIWNEVKKVPPAHCLTLRLGSKPIVNRYWSLNTGEQTISRSELVEEMASRLKASVKGHLQSDVPVGSFLSGGYDSSALVYMMRELGYKGNTFSIGFEDWNNSEHQFAEIVAKRFDMPLDSVIMEKSGLELLDRLAEVYDEPIADISTIPTYVVSQLASSKVKAVLSGEGADELFCGYTWQHDFKRMCSEKSVLTNFLQSVGLKAGVDSVGFYGNEAMAMGRFDDAHLKSLLTPQTYTERPKDIDWFYRQSFNSQLSPLKSIQMMDIPCFMGELVLTKIDRASMANSLEVRVPFLDHELFEYLLQFKESIYFEQGTQKVVLKSIIEDKMPEEILARKKQGFVGPDSFYQNISWYKKELRESSLVDNGLIQRAGIDKLIGNKDHWRLWKVLVLEKWHRRWA